ncbi:MAG: M48 family metalloprotease, partial [Planctomycetes bacterium]|nr:M48 family metalloprotease [Planctomycetota bacterium]
METLQNIFQAEIIQKLGWTLAHFVWQATTIALILAAILKLLHKSSANLRYIITCMALALIVVMPAVTIRMIDVSSNIIVPINRSATELPKTNTDTQTFLEIPQIEPTIKITASSRISLKDKFIETIEPVLPYSVAGWLAGVFGLSLWHLGGWRQLQKLRKKMLKNVPYQIAVTTKKLSHMLGIKKTINIAESALVEVPTVIGHLKPIILLPASALTGLSVQQIEAILAHELAHIKRHDYLVNILQTVVEILGFYHPAVWWVSHKIRAERENCCDDIAVNLCSDKVCYARALTTMEEIRTDKLSLAVAASGGNLLMRIRRLLGKESANEGKLSWLPSVITMLMIVALLIPTALALSGNNKEQFGEKTDITASNFKIVTNDRGINNLVVSIKNESDVAIPEFKIRYYMDNVKNNIDEAGNAHSGWHNAGPIESGQAWNEQTRDFHLPDGKYEFSVVLDYDNTISETDENNNIASIKVTIKGGQIKISEPTGQIESFEQQLKEPVTVHIDKSPDGDNLTIQYAVIAICKAASVPYNWDKSTELANPERKQYIEPVNIENKIASQAITDILGPVGLLYSVDVDGVYLYKAEHFAKMQSKLEILNIELEPIAQGKNILYANVKNTSDTEQLFAIHIYTRSVDYGSQGVGWGTRFF